MSNNKGKTLPNLEVSFLFYEVNEMYVEKKKILCHLILLLGLVRLLFFGESFVL